MSDLVPERVFDLSVKTGFIVRDGDDRQLEQRDFVGKDKIVARSALCQRDAFVEAQQQLVAAQAQFAHLIGRWLVGIRNSHIVEAFNISRRHFVHRARDQIVKLLVGNLLHHSSIS